MEVVINLRYVVVLSRRGIDSRNDSFFFDWFDLSIGNRRRFFSSFFVRLFLTDYWSVGSIQCCWQTSLDGSSLLWKTHSFAFSSCCLQKCFLEVKKCLWALMQTSKKNHFFHLSLVFAKHNIAFVVDMRLGSFIK